MKTKILVIIVLLSVCVSYASLEPIIVDLPDLTGSYPFFEGKVASFDLGQPIPFEIGEVYLTIEGSYEAGVALLDGTELRDPFHAGFASQIRTAEPMDIWWNPLRDPWMENHEIESCDFLIESRYEQIGNVSWDFLADGEAEIPLSFGTTINGATIILEPPSANLTSAYLKIYPVPEPAALILFGIGAFFLRGRRRV